MESTGETKHERGCSMWALREFQRRIGDNKESYLAHMDWRTDEQKTEFWSDETWRKYEALHKK